MSVGRTKIRAKKRARSVVRDARGPGRLVGVDAMPDFTVPALFDVDAGAGKRPCRDCGKIKPLADYPRKAGCYLGLGPACKACFGKRRSAQRLADLPARLAQEAAHRDKTRQQQRAWGRAYHARRRQEDPTLYPARQRARYWADPESARARDRAWHAANREASRVISTRRAARRRAALAAVPLVDFTREQLEARIAYWGGRCYLCGAPWEQVDHVKPVARGGPHCLANFRPTCGPCNNSKGATWHGPTWAMRLTGSRATTIPTGR